MASEIDGLPRPALPLLFGAGTPWSRRPRYPGWLDRQKIQRGTAIAGSVRLRSPEGHVPEEARWFFESDEIHEALAAGWEPTA